MADWPPAELTTLITSERIQKRVAELGQQVTRDYAGRRLVLVCVLKGSFVFAADLVRHISLPLRIDFLGLRSYGNAIESSGVVQITQDLTSPIRGDDVLVIEDIVDSGLTSTYLLDLLGARSPNSVRLCALLHKPARVKKAVRIDYLGFTIEDAFVVGYGLDHAQNYRHLPDLMVVSGTGVTQG